MHCNGEAYGHGELETPRSAVFRVLKHCRRLQYGSIVYKSDDAEGVWKDKKRLYYADYRIWREPKTLLPFSTGSASESSYFIATYR